MSPNCEYLRRGNKIEAFVIQMTEGTFKSCEEWMKDQKSQVSYHFLIDENGDDVCLVMPENTAWHAGLRVDSKDYTKYLGDNPNLTTIGIGLAGYAEKGPTIQQIVKCSMLMRTMANYYNITLDKNHVIPHHDIRTDKVCPGVYVDVGTLVYLSKLPQA